MKLETILQLDNIADNMDEEDLNRIGSDVVKNCQTDKDSRQEWFDKVLDARKISMQEVEAKSFPWPEAANVIFPLMSMASMQFASRSYPLLVQGRNVVKTAIWGDDSSGEKVKRSSRIAQHMNYQFLEDIPAWEESMDKMLHVLPGDGMCFKKVYWDNGPKSELVIVDDLIVDYWAKSLEDAARVTHKIPYTKNEILSKERSGIFLEYDYGTAQVPTELLGATQTDEDTPHFFHEQHRWLDLDDDGYEEPYIVTVHEASQNVVRIEKRFDVDSIEFSDKEEVIDIKAENFFTKYGFIPSADGSFYDMGYAHLLYPINKTVNTVLNQLLDSGTLANTGGGFLGRGIRMRGGNVRFRPGEWKFTESTGDDLRKNIVPMPRSEPSGTLFSLLGMMIESGEKLASVTDARMGQSPGTHVPATTTLALIEQGEKVFTGIAGRLHRSLKEEIRRVFYLNRLYMEDEEYFRILDPQPDEKAGQTIQINDYQQDETDVLPYSDPGVVSDMHRMKKMEALQGFYGRPEVNNKEIVKRSIEALALPDAHKIMEVQPQPDPKMLIETAKLENEKIKLEIKNRELELKIFEKTGQVFESRSRALKNFAEMQETPEPELADAAEMYAAVMREVEHEVPSEQGGMGRPEGPVPGLEDPPGNNGAVQGAQGRPPMVPGGDGQGIVPTRAYPPGVERG